jgi:hypothetical protein
VKASVSLIPGPPAGAEIKLSKDVITADEDDRQVTATIQLVDGAGRPVPPQAARMISDHGHLLDLKKNDGGTRTFKWVVPWARGRSEATLSVELSPSRQVLAKQTIKMLPGAPAKMSFEKGGAVIADGNASVDLKLRASDKWGTPLVLEGAVVEVDEGAGKIENKVDGETLRVKFTPSPVEQLRIVNVRAQFGDVKAETLVNVRPAPQLAVLVAPGLAVGTNYENLVSVGPDVSVLVRLPIVDGALHVGGSIAFMQSVVRPGTAADQRAIPLLVEAAWRPPMSEQVDLHLGLAGGPLLAHSVRPPDDNFVEFGIAAQAVLGAAVKVGPGTVDILARLGSSNYVGAVQRGKEIVGVPYGGALVVSYRFAL